MGNRRGGGGEEERKAEGGVRGRGEGTEEVKTRRSEIRATG